MARAVSPPQLTLSVDQTSTESIVTAAADARRRAASRSAARIARDTVLYLLIPVAAVLAWWFGSLESTSPFFPPLAEILVRFQELWLFDRFLSDVVPSLSRMFAGYGLGVVVGIVLGLICGRIKPVYRVLSPYIHFGRSIPAIALLPIFITLLGIGDLMTVVLIATSCTFPVLLNTIDGAASVDAGFEDVAKTFQFTRPQWIFFVVLPFTAPRIFTGARIALSVALILMIASEMFASVNGIGLLTIQAQQNFNVRSMWAGMLLLGVLGVAFNVLFLLVQRRVIPWTSTPPEQ